MVAITESNVIELLEQCIADRGEHYIDPQAESGTCTYVDYHGDHPKPGCIVGLVLIKAGYDIVTLDLWDSEISGLTGSTNPDEIEGKTGVQVDDKALYALRTAQDRQDCGKTWGDALRAAADALTQEEQD